MNTSYTKGVGCGTLMSWRESDSHNLLYTAQRRSVYTIIDIKQHLTRMYLYCNGCRLKFLKVSLASWRAPLLALHSSARWLAMPRSPLILDLAILGSAYIFLSSSQMETVACKLVKYIHMTDFVFVVSSYFLRWGEDTVECMRACCLWWLLWTFRYNVDVFVTFYVWYMDTSVFNFIILVWNATSSDRTVLLFDIWWVSFWCSLFTNLLAAVSCNWSVFNRFSM